MCYEHNVLSAALRWSAGWKSFSARLSSLGRKILFHPAGSLSFSYCLLSLLAWSASTRFLWLKTAAGQPGLGSHAIGSVTTQKNRKRVPRCLDLPPTMKINVKNLDTSHRLALSVEHSRVFRFQGDLLLMSLYLLMLRIKRNNKVGKRWRQPVEFLPWRYSKEWSISIQDFVI